MIRSPALNNPTAAGPNKTPNTTEPACRSKKRASCVKKLPTEKPINSLVCRHENLKLGLQEVIFHTRTSEIKSARSRCHTSDQTPKPAQAIRMPTRPPTIVEKFVRIDRLRKFICRVK